MSHSGIRASPSTDQDRSERRWALVRLTLGILQMTGAALALGLLAAGGVTRASLTVVVLTGLMPDAAYRDWVGEHVGFLFTNQRTDAEGLTFSLPLEGDLQTLRIALTGSDGQLRVHGEFTVRPW